VRRSPRIPNPPPQFIDTPRGNQLPQRAPMRSAEQRPSIDNPIVLNQPSARPIASIKGHQSHARHPSEANQGGDRLEGTGAPHQTLNPEP